MSRSDSQTSVGSVGIGYNQVTRNEEDIVARLCPEGGVPHNMQSYDCIVYLMYCSVHDRIAVTNVERTKVVWFPFVAMTENVTWEQASMDGVAMLLGKRDAELDSKLQGKLPKFQMSNLHVLRVQMPFERFFIRIAQFVNIEKSEEFICCESNRNLVWVPASDILNDRIENLWGPEVKLFTTMLINPEQKFIYEYSIENALKFVNGDQSQTYQSKLLTSCKMQIDTVMSIYDEFVDHCFPSFFMSLDSFKTFLIKFGYPKNDPRFPWIFNAVGYNRKGFIDFTEFLIGLVCMEPSTENGEARLRMLFRYYDVGNDQVLTIKEFVALTQDLNPNANAEQLRQLVDNGIRTMMPDKKLTFEAFQKLVQSHTLKGTQTLCRSQRALIPQIVKSSKVKNEERVSSPKGDLVNDKKLMKKKDRGICTTCRSQKYTYGLHCVYIDTNGKCVKPLRLRDVKFSPEDPIITPMRYSAEFVFGIGSICNMFVDVIRDTYRKNDSAGLMANAEEAPSFARYLKTLCENVSDLLLGEDRMIKINAPAYVVGDILGNLDSLLTMERLLWQSIPVLPINIIFLGNYIGPNKNCVEVISYLFALKMLLPAKVILLRGFNECKECSANMINECIQKYGNEIGRFIWESINDVFEKLPFAAVVDESILCVHSGIPKLSGRIAKFLEIPEEISNVEKECPLAFEILSNVPTESEKTNMEPFKKLYNNEFNAATLNTFLKTNCLSYMIRGHESLKEGFRLNHGNKCITICSNDVSPMVVFIDQTITSIRLLKLCPTMRAKNGGGKEMNI